MEKVACPSDPAQTYALYLPSAYTTERRWPLLFVFDPRGRGTFAAEIFRDAAERFGWIIASSDNTQSDGAWEPNARALAAMWPDVLRGYAVDPKRIYAAGFSGGASVAWALGRETGAIAGVIASGAPNPGTESPKPVRFAWFGSAGRADFNFPRREGDRCANRRRRPIPIASSTSTAGTSGSRVRWPCGLSAGSKCSR